MLLRSCVGVAALFASANAFRAPTVERYFLDVASQLFYIDYSNESGTTAFSYYAQNAGLYLIPLLRKLDHEYKRNVTILVPSTGSFIDWVTSQGGNFTDPETLSTAEWNEKWADTFQYFFAIGRTNLSVSETNMSTILDTGKTSPVGDWPLQISYQYNASKAEEAAAAGTIYNGTVSTSALTTGDLTIGDLWVDRSVAQVLNAWPVEPMGLGESLEALNVTGWSDVAQRTSRADLSRRNDFTLFVPPAAAWEAALNSSDAQLTAFVDAHLSIGDLLVMPEDSDPASLSMADGSSITASISSVAKAGRSISVLQRDVLTNCGRLQLISESLYQPNVTKRAVDEL